MGKSLSSDSARSKKKPRGVVPDARERIPTGAGRQ